MKSSYLLHHLIFSSAVEHSSREAIKYGTQSLSYSQLSEQCQNFSQALSNSRWSSQDRVAIYLEKRLEFVVSCFGTSCAGGLFVPVNPILKADQVLHILKDSGARWFVTSRERLQLIENKLNETDVHTIVLTEEDEAGESYTLQNKSISLISWGKFIKSSFGAGGAHKDPEYSQEKMVDTDAVAILYTSGSTGRPKGVVLSHRNMVFGAKNVSSYLENNKEDRLLAVLPLSFDAGFSQLTTAFFSGACVVLLNYILPRDILSVVVSEKITGITAVPPLWIQITNLKWPASVSSHLRYFANTGGRMPFHVLQTLRGHFPQSKPFLMYGLTESFRSTYLPPEEVDRRPNSIGKAIPNAEILVLKPDGTPCGPREPGELVHRGALVGLGYWKDPEKTAERYKPLPAQSGCRPQGIVMQEFAVFSGDLVEKDEEGFLYFIGRNDEMMKTSGYRVSPVEVEEVIYNSGYAQEVAAFAIDHETLGQAIIVSVMLKVEFSSLPEPKETEIKENIFAFCRREMPVYMVPQEILVRRDEHPRNQNGKIDRKLLSKNFATQRSSK